MIKRSLHQKHRAAALVGAAVVLATATTATRAQAQLPDNLFGGTPSPAAATASETALGGNTNSGTVTLGSNYNGTVTIPTGVLASVSETVNTSALPDTFVLSATGATLGATFEADKTFAAAGLQPSSLYQLSFTTTTNASVNLLSTAGFVLSNNGTPFADTITGQGILGTANVLGVLNNGGEATVTFETPANITTATAVNIAIEGNLAATVGVGSTTLEVTGASIQAVPEPNTLASACLSLFGLAFWRVCRRQRVG